MCFSKNILIGDRIDLLYSNLENKLKIFTGQLHIAFKCKSGFEMQ